MEKSRKYRVSTGKEEGSSTAIQDKHADNIDHSTALTHDILGEDCVTADALNKVFEGTETC